MIANKGFYTTAKRVNRLMKEMGLVVVLKRRSITITFQEV